MSYTNKRHMSTEKNPAKKWGDTKIAERGRSVLVMRARCRSAGLTLHQREWTDAAGRYHGCNCVIDQCKCSCFYTTLRERARCILHHCSLSYARDQHGLHGARIMLSVRIEDPLPGRRAGSWCGTAQKNHELFLGWEGGRKVVGWRIRGSSTCPIAADRGEKCRTIYFCMSFLRAVVVVLVVWIIVLIHFVMANFFLHMYAQQMFSALYTGVLNTIACVSKKGVSEGFPAVLQLAVVSNVRDSVGRGKCLHFFYRGLMCMCCVCVRTHPHTHCTWGIRMWARVLGRDIWRARKKSRCTVAIVYIYTVRCTKYTCIYICWATGRSLD